RSVTCRTASILNSSGYRLLLMDTSESAIFHGLEMSRKSWAYHFKRMGVNLLEIIGRTKPPSRCISTSTLDNAR
ncbi:hypothetical protein, partial [Xanthomonas phaseoli]|uniref:hypothetical protein n=1 Tax=Xanthomonas phaseoli TaxID=1985254 RepID=UPI0019553126